MPDTFANLSTVLGFTLGALLTTMSLATAGAWFLSAKVAILTDHARRLGTLEADRRTQDATSADIDSRLARIETTLEFIATGLPCAKDAMHGAGHAG